MTTAKPLARYGAIGARFASGFATAQLHHFGDTTFHGLLSLLKGSQGHPVSGGGSHDVPLDGRRPRQPGRTPLGAEMLAAVVTGRSSQVFFRLRRTIRDNLLF
jgi:hypothetical protein